MRREQICSLFAAVAVDATDVLTADVVSEAEERDVEASRVVVDASVAAVLASAVPRVFEARVETTAVVTSTIEEPVVSVVVPASAVARLEEIVASARVDVEAA